MKANKTIYTITGTDADGICKSQTPLAAGALTQDGALAAGIPTGQHVTVTCAGADAGRSFVVIGTNTSGQTISETIAGSDGSTTTGTSNFKTIASVTVDAATADAITVGWVATLETPWVPLDTGKAPFHYGYHVDITTATFTVEGTLDDLQDSSITPAFFVVQASGTADIAGSSTVPANGTRVKVTAWTSGTVTFRTLQAG
jgi:hypothetical protein